MLIGGGGGGGGAATGGWLAAYLPTYLRQWGQPGPRVGHGGSASLVGPSWRRGSPLSGKRVAGRAGMGGAPCQATARKVEEEEEEGLAQRHANVPAAPVFLDECNECNE